jgi:putative ABC transport system permease protein
VGAALLAYRIIRGDLRRHPVEAVLFLLAVTAAIATLTLGLALNGAASVLYSQTRTATRGPDVVAVSDGGSTTMLSSLMTVSHAATVASHSGPYPVLDTLVKAGGYTVQAEVEGRSTAPAAIDQPLVTSGSWLRPGCAVVERGFARALGIRVGDRITVAGRAFPVVGLAVTAANPVYPWGEESGQDGPTPLGGLMWLTEADTRALSPQPAAYVLDLRLTNPASAETFVASYDMSAIPVNFFTWQVIAGQDAVALHQTEPVLDVGAWLLGFLAIAGVAGLAAGRAAQQTRRVGLLKAVGASPGLIAAVLLAEYLILALAADALGLLTGWLAAPALSDPSSGLIGAMTPPGAGAIAALTFLALAAAILTTIAPTLRAVRTSTIRALADSPRPPRRPALTALTLWLPTPILLGVQLTARRPVRTLLHAAGITATVTAITALLTYYSQPPHGYYLGSSTLTDLQNAQGRRVLLAVTAALVILAAVNIIVITWTTALETRRPLAIARTLGATPGQVTAGISLAQLLPALPAAITGIPAGIGLYAINSIGTMSAPPAWRLVTAAAGIVLAIAAITAIPARIAARPPVAEVLSSEAP